METILLILLAIFIFIGGIGYGIVAYKFKLFPYHLLKKSAPPMGGWSIGICTGKTPFDLSSSAHPVLSATDVTDINASLVADPFMIKTEDNYTMFFEVMNQDSAKGEIGCAVSNDGTTWQYKKIVLKEPFHLSYPYVFEWENSYFMIPESGADLSVRLYRAKSFPDQWEYLGNLLSGYNYADPTLFHHEGKWWMLVSTPAGNHLNLYYSEQLITGWVPHPMNPIVKDNNKISRPAGRVIVDHGKIYRFAQSGYPTYGSDVFAIEITELTETTYEEIIVSDDPIIGMSGKGWNAAGMHQIDLHRHDDHWMAVVDGKSR